LIEGHTALVAAMQLPGSGYSKDWPVDCG